MCNDNAYYELKYVKYLGTVNNSFDCFSIFRTFIPQNKKRNTFIVAVEKCAQVVALSY